MACVKKCHRTRNDSYKMTGWTGTMAYMAPEVALQKPYNEKVDIYSFGIILWEMISGETPFEGYSPEYFIQNVAHGGERPPLTPLFARNVPYRLIKLLQSCWDANPAQRPDCKTIERSLSLHLTELDPSVSRSPYLPFPSHLRKQPSILMETVHRIVHGRVYNSSIGYDSFQVGTWGRKVK